MTVCMVISLLSLVYIHRICGCMYGFGQPYMWYVDLALLDMLLCKCVHVHPHMICGSSTVGYAAVQLCPCTPTHDLWIQHCWICCCANVFMYTHTWSVDPALLDMLLHNYVHVHPHMICGSSTVGYAAAQLCPCTPTHDPALLLLSNYQHTHTHKWQPAEYAHRRMSLLSATSRTQTWRTCWICTQEDELVKCNKQNANMDMLNMHTGGWAC